LQVAAEARLGLVDHTLRRERDQVVRLVLLELVVLDEAKLGRGGDDALLEVAGVEREAVAEELDDGVVARGVVGVAQIRPWFQNSPAVPCPTRAPIPCVSCWCRQPTGRASSIWRRSSSSVSASSGPS